MLQSLILVAFDWATRCFGREQMRDARTRSIRVVEEAVELAQASGVDVKDVILAANEVYRRPPGEKYQEVGGVLMTTFLFCQMMGEYPEHVFLAELRRVLAKSHDSTHFAKRNAEKINLFGDDDKLPPYFCTAADNPDKLPNPPRYTSTDIPPDRLVPRYTSTDKWPDRDSIPEGLPPPLMLQDEFGPVAGFILPGDEL